MSNAVAIAQYGSNNPAWRNRIINGDMRIDQRNNGASVANSSGGAYFVDRWVAANPTGGGTVQRSTVAPAGFTNSFLITNGTGASPAAGAVNFFFQNIEGFNVADLAFGTAAAASITVSFWVRSSVTGTYAFRLSNAASNRTYVATYTINSANTFEFKTVTIAGDTSGTWLTDNGLGLQIFFDLGSGSNFNGTGGSWQAANATRTSGSVNWVATTGATFFITGVQLEAGTNETPFERRSYGTELMLCQRYFQFWKSGWSGVSGGSGFQYSDGVNFCVPTRATPTLALTSYSSGARFPQANWATTNVGVEGFLSISVATSAGGNDNWLATGTASAEL